MDGLQLTKEERKELNLAKEAFPEGAEFFVDQKFKLTDAEDETPERHIHVRLPEGESMPTKQAVLDAIAAKKTSKQTEKTGRRQAFNFIKTTLNLNNKQTKNFIRAMHSLSAFLDEIEEEE